MNTRTLSAVTLGAFLLSFAIGLIAGMITDNIIFGTVCISILIFGIALAAISLLYSGGHSNFGPSEGMYKMVSGIMLAATGLIGTLAVYTDISLTILAAIFIVILALAIIIVALINGKKEGN